jgi:biotin carboxyl carrier protein
VTRGQALLTIEAMKMENVIRAPRDGRVKSVHVAVGARVAPGTPLVEME